MKVIDSHLHLDRTKYPQLKDAVFGLNDELEKANVETAILLHLEVQQWCYKELAHELVNYPRIKAFINIEPRNEDAKDKLFDAVSNHNYKGLKIHPRLQKLELMDPALIALVKYAGVLKVPVLIDAFPDGNAIMDGFSPKQYADLALAAPDSKIIWAHMGGHYVIDMMMLAKRLPNVYMDCSYSLLYYRGSSVVDDLVYAMKSMRFNKLFYGSDYPDRSVKATLESSIKELKARDVSDDQLQKLLYNNFMEFMNWETN